MERYYTFWRRLGALLFDAIILLPVSYLISTKAPLTGVQADFIWMALPTVVAILYNVILTGLVGQTIGKIVMGIKVLDVNEQRVIGLKRAFYRESVFFTIEIASLLVLGYQTITKGSVNSETSYLIDNILQTASFSWAVLELVTMLFNPKRRAIHDFLASSVVISLRGQRFDLHYEQLERQRAM